MIFVTIGTTERFDRLLAALDTLAADEEVVVQCGDSTTRPARSTCVEFLPYDELVDHIRRARVVVAHAGVGTIMTALANGKRPILVPRRARFGEAVDDHQVELSAHLEQLGLVTVVHDLADLKAAVGDVARRVHATSEARDGHGLVSDIRAYLEDEIPRRRAKDAIGG
jgi:UDP-N-acetylglucosamine transferase subunit ALG13